MPEENPIHDPDLKRDSFDEELANLRQTIDALDDSMLRLLNERARVIQQVVKVKNHYATDFYIPSREKAVLQRLCDLNAGPLSFEAVSSVFREIISACRAMEAQLSIAYLGPEGSYHHAAAQAHFGRSARFLPIPTILAIFDEVERDRVDYGIVAIENSNEGSLGENLDRLAHSKVRVVGEVYLPISHNLISFSELHEITHVYSHPQALAQCRRWLQSNLPNVRQVDTPSTTHAVGLCKDNRAAAAVAGALAAEMMEVPIQVRAIEDYAGNTTRFFVIGKNPVPRSGDDKTSLVVFVRDRVGALYAMLEPFKNHGINLTNIVSRPIKQEAWQYMFFLECQGHREEPILCQALEEIERNSLYVRILGSYPQARKQPADTSLDSE